MSLMHFIVTGEAGHGKDTIGDRLVANYGYAIIGFADAIKDETSARYVNSPDKITRDYLNNRRTKNLPLPGLALRFCSDDDYVKIALREFDNEDRALFSQLRDVCIKENTHFPSMDDKKFGTSSWHHNMTRDNFLDTERLMLPRSSRRITQIYGTEYRRTAPFGHPTYWIDVVANEIQSSTTPKAICGGRYKDEIDFAKSHGYPRIHVVRPGHGEVAVQHASEIIAPPDNDTIVLINDATVEDLHRKVDHMMSLLLAGKSARHIAGEFAGEPAHLVRENKRFAMI